MASRAIDLVITYRIVKLLVTPFERQEAYKQGIIDKDGNVLKKYKTLKTTKEKQSYTILHRFVFNLKRILKRVGLR
jgi:endo-1,4-beta-D-glucanase Y